MRRSWFVVLGIFVVLVIVIGIVGSQWDISSAQDGTGIAQVPTSFPTNTPFGTVSVQTSEGTDIPAEQTLPSATPTTTLTPTPSITPTTIGPYEYPENYNPLTGLPYPNEEARDRRNLLVKISNFPPVVRPQYGLSGADIVFEYEAEGGVTRFAALYRSQSPGKVGSIRSARLVDLELVEMFEALLAYSGSNEWVWQYILDSDWRWRAISPHLQNYPCPTFCRYEEDGLAFEHTLFGDTDGIWEEAEKIDVNQGYQAVGLAFSEEPDPGGEMANDIFIDWYHETEETRWQYNPEDNRYYRWDGGLPHIDAATGEQLSVDNLIVLEVYHVDRPEVYSGYAGIALEHTIWGYARAFVFRDGRWYQGWWYRNRDYGSLQLRYDHRDRQSPMRLRPGQSWITIVRKLDPYATSGPLFSVTVSEEKVDAVATAQSVEATQTTAAIATATQYVEFYGTPQPGWPTWTPTSESDNSE